jgi:type IV pilus assembly protein PilM
MRRLRILAVDCGASRVACGLMVRDRTGGLVLEHLAVAPLTQPEANEAEWLNEVEAALRGLDDRQRLRGPCVVGLPGHLTFNRVIRLPLVSGHRRRGILRFEARQAVAPSTGAMVWGCEAIATDEQGLEVALTAASRALLEGLCARLRAAGLFPSAVIPAWAVLDRAFGGDRGDRREAIILSVGARTTHLILRGGPRFCLRTLNVGGNTLTRKVAEELAMDFARAEIIKRQVLDGVGDSSPGAPENRAVQIAGEQFVQRLAGEITRSMTSFPFAEGERQPARLGLVGGGSLIPRLPELLADKLLIKVERWDSPKDLRVGGAVSGLPRGSVAMLLPVMGGLAACTTTRGRPPINLLPRTVRLEMFFRCRWRWLAAATLIVAAGLLTEAGRLKTMAADTSRRSAELETKIRLSRGIDARNRENRNRLIEINRRIAALQRIAESRSGWNALLTDLQGRLVRTEDAWLERLQILPPVKDDPRGRRTPVTRNPEAHPTSRGAGGEAPSAPSWRLLLGGCLFDAVQPLAKPGAGSYLRARMLLAELRASPFCAAVESERFESSQPGMLRFEITLVIVPQRMP